MKRNLLFLSAWLSLSATIFAQTVTVPMTAEYWAVAEGSDVRWEEHQGQKAMYLQGEALLQKVDALRNGIFEMDLASVGGRGFTGIAFRAQDPGNLEDVYVRMHKSGHPDALQYAPVFNHETTWQLYREHQAELTFDPRAYNHLRLVVRGQRLEVFFNRSEAPVLVVENLRREAAPGGVSLRSSNGAWFANFQYTPLPDDADVPAPVVAAAPGTVERWQLSPASTTEETDIMTYPGSEQLQKLDWTWVQAEPSGLLPINRYRTKAKSGNFESNTEDVVWARLETNSAAAATRLFYFDFSDRAVVFLNGQPLFAGHNSFWFKGRTFRGDLHVEGNMLFLPLRAGRNELLIAVADKANGWALLGKFGDAAGLEY